MGRFERPDWPSAPALTVEAADGTAIAVWHLGGEGPPLLMAHATGFCAGVWLPMAEGLSAEFSCWALDMRGHGLSTCPPDRLGWDLMGDDLLRCAVEVQARSASGPLVGVGHSMGGAAMILAAQRQPETFDRLWVFEPIIFPPGLAEGGGNPLSEGALRRRSTFESREDAFANFAAKRPLSALSEEALAAYVRYGFSGDGPIELRCPPESEAQLYRNGVLHSAWAHLPETNVPVQVAVGVEHEFTPAALAPVIATELADGSLAEFRHLGHFGPLESPGECAVSVLRGPADAPTMAPAR